MTTKEQVIRESIARVNMRLCEINNILDATPLIDILNLRKEAQDLLNKNLKIEQRVSNEMLDKIEEYSKKEKEFFALAKIQQEKTIELLEEKAHLTIELGDLNGELYFIELKNNHEKL
jgi:hypothetical protein